MIIEDQDAFKTWLTAVLKPLCDADPEALAKYVIALVKKDKSPEALHQSMVNQLQVFLQTETEPFVAQLFRTLETQDYINALTIPNANPPNPELAKPPPLKMKAPLIPVSEIASALSETLNGKGSVGIPSALSTAPSGPLTRRERDEEKLRATEKDRRRSRRRSLSRNRSRSRSWERPARRSRSPRDKTREHAYKRMREWRNKSPAYRERRRSLSPKARSSRSRSPRHGYRGGGRYRNRSPPRSLTRSPEKDSKEMKDKDEEMTTAILLENNHEDIKSTVNAVPSTIIQNNPEARKRRCRDYDEEGYCMRGGLCPYDHGVDAVVLEDSALSRVLYPNGSNDSLLGPTPNLAPHIMHSRPPMPTEYNPQAPQMWHQRGGGGFRGGGHRMNLAGPPPRMPMGQFVSPLPPIQQQRELIAVPVMGGASGNYSAFPSGPPPPHPPSSNSYHPENVFKKKHFDFNRLGPRQKHPANCSLELKKIPTGMNNITYLNNHFVKFGKIVNIQVSFDGDPEAAIVMFSSHAEANAAYRSTEAVLNNRFIKVFWHTAEPMKDAQRSVKDRLGISMTMNNKFVNKDKENLEEEEEVKKEEMKVQQTLAIQKSQDLLAAKEKMKRSAEEKRKEAQKMTQDLRKRKQDLLEKQIAQQKLLIEKVARCGVGQQRDALKQTIRKGHEAIEVMRKELEQAMLAMKATTIVTTTTTLIKRSKEAIQKELLDTELDIISKQVEGVDTSELQRKLWTLKAKTGVGVGVLGVGAGGVGVGRGRGRGGRRFNPMALRRHKLVKNNVGSGVEGAKSVDHRPTRLLVSGYETDEQENVLEHFRQFGEIVEFESDAAVPSVVVHYKTRKEAEVAFSKGKHFQDRTLSITWHLQNQISRQSSHSVLINPSSDDDQHLDAVTLLDGDEEVCGALSEDILLVDDEEEEEENEDRSWRR